VKVRCISRSARDLPADIKPERVWGNFEKVTDRLFPLVVGKEYVVYGVTITLGHVWYYICDEEFVYYPVWNPSSLFEVSDSSIPEFWRIRVRAARGYQEERFLLSFPEWVNDDFFYDKLTDGKDEEVRIFNHYRRLLESNSDES
jgi:hypothetical protein